ncbi:MAG: hypothetical protein H7Y02_00170 [Candidatus Obscuribacterales bacterium]|nr:hypothetical protein [Steroidobacteraceae bacterium]
MKLNALGRKQVASIYASFRAVCRGVPSSGAHFALLRQSLHESRELELELNDSLIARLLTLEGRCDADASTWLAEWDAIEKNSIAPQLKLKALRVLFTNLATQAGTATTAARHQIETTGAK